MRRLETTGFTLVELMVVVAITALLAAMAIPQYLRFQLIALRVEGIITLSAAHKSQMSYFSTNDRFFSGGCTSGPGMIANCDATVPQEIIINQYLGMPFINTTYIMTPHGYVYYWNFVDLSKGYELRLNKTLLPNAIVDDNLIIGVHGYYKNDLNCGICGYEDGRPFILNDGITSAINCPC